jgi:hypothetical protein
MELGMRDCFFPPAGLTAIASFIYCKICTASIELVIQLDPALIAQLVERVTSNDEVAGSTPS